VKITYKEKSPSAKAKGLESLGSPDCNIDRTFTSTFYFPQQVTKTNQIKCLYRNPIYLARKYKRMIDNGQVKNQSGLARKLGISRARVTQILNLLKLDKSIIDNLEQIGDPMDRKVISERELRKITHHD